MAPHEHIHDAFGRTVSYMRLSVTDRCNLRCFYCRAAEDESFIHHEKILRYEEMIRLVRAGVELGIEKLRLTGGEPFARKDFLAFLGMLKEEFPGLDTRLTTNGTLLRGKAPALKHLGVSRVNVSLDTLDREKYREITGRDRFDRVMEAVEECLGYGLSVKINVVALKGVNHDELADFVDLAASRPLDVRFIEFMPIGGGTCWDESRLWPAPEILRSIEAMARLEPAGKRGRTSGPARVYDIVGGRGRIGVISPMSDHFCDSCNRLRITADGRLRTCLFSDREARLLPVLRDSHKGDADILELMKSELADKPLGYKLLEKNGAGSVCRRIMSSIGG
jgi:cyclic pyranopterin phosphate synthase